MSEGVLTLFLGTALGLATLCGCSQTADGHTIAHWKFDGPVGTDVTDLAGSHVGRVRGAPRSGTRAWSFPGDTSSVQVRHHAALDLVSGFTIEAILRPERLGNPANPEGFQAIVEKHAAPGGYLLVLRPSGKLEYWLETADGRMRDSSAVAIELDAEWHHVAMTWDGESIALFVDGAAAGQRAFRGPLGSCPQDLFLANDDNLWWGYGGGIRELRISEVALPPGAFLSVE
jgi:hypothetical protein